MVITPTEFTALARPVVLANRGYSKIFGIGQNKTGTTSLESIFRLYGFRVPNQQQQEALLTHRTFCGDYSPLRSFCSQYDCFQDQPFSQKTVYVAADCLFPNSKFILTIRDPDIWYESLARFMCKIYGVNDVTLISEDHVRSNGYLGGEYVYKNYKRSVTQYNNDGSSYARWDLLFDRDTRIDNYVRRNQEIMSYFYGRPDDLLVVDFSKERDTRSFCDFLCIPTQLSIEVPHLNRT